MRRRFNASTRGEDLWPGNATRRAASRRNRTRLITSSCERVRRHRRTPIATTDRSRGSEREEVSGKQDAPPRRRTPPPVQSPPRGLYPPPMKPPHSNRHGGSGRPPSDRGPFRGAGGSSQPPPGHGHQGDRQQRRDHGGAG